MFIQGVLVTSENAIPASTEFSQGNDVLGRSSLLVLFVRIKQIVVGDVRNTDDKDSHPPFGAVHDERWDVDDRTL